MGRFYRLIKGGEPEAIVARPFELATRPKAHSTDHHQHGMTGQ
jgi:hypothetical protein